MAESAAAGDRAVTVMPATTQEWPAMLDTRITETKRPSAHRQTRTPHKILTFHVGKELLAASDGDVRQYAAARFGA